MFNWVEFLQLAEQLAEGNPTEAQLRTSTSRAYYAFLNCARDWLVANGSVVIERRAGDTHMQVWRRFKQSHRRVWKRVGHEGEKLKFRREAADYEPRPGDATKLVKDTIIRVKRMIALLETLPSEG